MAKQCIVTGKSTKSGNQVSHSNQRTKRTFKPNLLRRKLINPATGNYVKVWISAKGLKTLQKWDREGKAYDLKDMKKRAK